MHVSPERYERALGWMTVAVAYCRVKFERRYSSYLHGRFDDVDICMSV